ncbi:MAG: molybdenum cofactor synthesis domain-containing protein [Janthinobacterium lividum]
MPTDARRPFQPVNIAVLTVSDTRTPLTDRSGDALAERVTGAGHLLARRDIVVDTIDGIEVVLQQWIADPTIEVIISTGGTGITGRDVTPEAFARVLEKEIPGFGELFRSQSFAKIGASAMFSRAVAGVANGKYLFALPGSPGAVADAWDGILAGQLDSRTNACTLLQLKPRLLER